MAATPVAETTRPPAPPEIVNDRSFFGHPKGLATRFTTEMWERFSYYGLRPLLILFMTAVVTQGGYGFSRDEAGAIVGIYAALVYLMSLPGGWVADKWLGLRRAIWYGAILITLGHLSIGVSGFATSKVPFFAGLALIVLGTGLLKPNISAIVGDLYPEGGARRDAGFSIFYMGINFGAFFGQILTGILAQKYGWHWGFGAAGVGMLVGLITYWIFAGKALGPIGQDIVRHPDPAVQAASERQVKTILVAGLAILVLVFALAAVGIMPLNAQAIGKSMTAVLLGVGAAFFAYMIFLGGLTSDEKKRVGVIAVLFVFAAIFWSAFEQAPTSLNLFANDFTDRVFDTSGVSAGMRTPALWGGLLMVAGSVLWFVLHVMKHRTTQGFPLLPAVGVLLVGVVIAFLGSVAGQPTFEVPALWYQSINSLFIILFAPMFAALWVKLGPKDLSAPMKFALGLALAGLGFAVMIPISNQILTHSTSGATDVLKVSSWWLVISYLFQTLGELSLSPVGLSSMTKLAPRKFVGQMMGIWFLAASVGNLIAGLVGGHVDPEKLEQMPKLFTTTTLFLFASAAILALLSIPIKKMMAGVRTEETGALQQAVSTAADAPPNDAPLG